jgi:hypothetical protein
MTMGNGLSTLKPKGHARREQLAARTDRLAAAADEALKDGNLYAIDPEKLKAEPEILRHMDPNNYMFEVTDPVPGKVYYWERDDHTMIAARKAVARGMLGAGHSGWEVVTGDMPECKDLKHADGGRAIGDVRLMRIDLESYVLIQKRRMILEKFRNSNIAQKLSDFVKENEGKVQVISGHEDPRTIYARENPGRTLVHTSRGPSEATA